MSTASSGGSPWLFLEPGALDWASAGGGCWAMGIDPAAQSSLHLEVPVLSERAVTLEGLAHDRSCCAGQVPRYLGS